MKWKECANILPQSSEKNNEDIETSGKYAGVSSGEEANDQSFAALQLSKS